MTHTISGTDRTALSLLLENARRETIRIWAEQAPFDLKDELKKRGYRWSPGDEGRPKAWYVDIDDAKRDDEIAYLRKSIYLRDVDLLAQTLSAVRPILDPNLIGFTRARFGSCKVPER